MSLGGCHPLSSKKGVHWISSRRHHHHHYHCHHHHCRHLVIIVWMVKVMVMVMVQAGPFCDKSFARTRGSSPLRLQPAHNDHRWPSFPMIRRRRRWWRLTPEKDFLEISTWTNFTVWLVYLWDFVKCCEIMANECSAVFQNMQVLASSGVCCHICPTCSFVSDKKWKCSESTTIASSHMKAVGMKWDEGPR